MSDSIKKIVDYDDKDLVIVAAFCIAMVAMFQLPSPENIVLSVVSGLFGVAVGRATK